MRAAVLGLLAINLLVLLWHLLRPQTDDVRSVDLGGSELALLSELAADQLQAKERCWLVGPFLSDPREVLGELALVFDSARWQLNEFDEGQQLHRVYVSPPESVAVSAFLSGLNEAIDTAGYNIDSYIVADGVLAGSISLGLFADADNALRVHGQLQELGYDPVTALESRPVVREWLQLWYQDLEEQARQSLLALFDTMALAVTENLCETIAHQK